MMTAGLAVAADDVQLTQEKVGTNASGKSTATLNVDGSGQLVLNSTGNRSGPVQTNTADGGLGNTLVLTLDSGNASASDTNTIYLSQIGGSYFALGINGTNNTVTVVNLKGTSNLVGDAVSVNIVGDSNTLELNAAVAGNIADSLDIDLGASGDATLTTGNLLYVDYSKFADIAATLVNTTGYDLDINQLDVGAATATATVNNVIDVDIDGSTADLSDISQTGVNNEIVVNVGGDTGFDITQDNRDSGNENFINVTGTTSNGGTENTISSTQTNSVQVDANVSQSADIDFTSAGNTITLSQTVSDAAAVGGTATDTSNTIGVDVTGNGNTIGMTQSIAGVDNLNQDNLIRESTSATQADISSSNSDIAVTQAIGTGSVAGSSLAAVTTDAMNTLNLALSGSTLDIDVSQNVIQGTSSDTTGAVSNTATITNASNFSKIDLNQTTSAFAGATTAADITVNDGPSALTNSSTARNDLDIDQANSLGGSMNLSLGVFGVNNDVDIRQDNSAATGSSTDSNLQITFTVDNATLDVTANGAGTNVLGINGTGNNITFDNQGELSLANADSITTIYGDNNTVAADTFDDLRIVIGTYGTSLSGNSVTTSGNAYIKLLGTDGDATSNVINYDGSAYDTTVTGMANPTIKVDGLTNSIYLEDNGDGTAGSASVTDVTGDSNVLRGFDNGAGAAGGYFTLTDSQAASVTLTGDSNELYSSAKDATGSDSLSGFSTLAITVNGNSNAIYAFGDGNASSTLDLNVVGDTNELSINAGSSAPSGAFDLDVLGNANTMSYALGYGNLTHEIDGNGFVGSVEGFGGSYYFQKLTTLGSGTLTLGTDAGDMTITANAGT